MISMLKDYRYRNGEPARILCVDRPGKYPVVSLDEHGNIHAHRSDGKMTYNEYPYDLIEVGLYDHINEGRIVKIEFREGKTHYVIYREW